MSDPAANSANTAKVFLQPGAIALPALPPLALYVHFPWCVRKCPYCDFNSHAVQAQGIPEEAYLQALYTDLTQSLPLIWGRRIHTIFIGGGTPSLLSAAGLDKLLSDIRALLPVEADAEITLEANPGTFEVEKFKQFRASGVNRLSIGVQSFQDKYLQALGRIHSGAEAQAAIEQALKVFDNVNLDLMFALPQQSLADCQLDVETALGYQTQHVSLYHLTLEPNTQFAKYPPTLPDDDTAFAMQDWIGARLEQAGYQHYEVSAYAKPGKRCRHNLNYWEFGDYLGIGAGAHGKLSFPNRILRQTKPRNPDSYIQAMARGETVQDEVEIPRQELPFEFMLNALRLIEGVPTESFADRTGLPWLLLRKKIAQAIVQGLLVDDPKRIVATPHGQRFLNNLQEMFL